jgi:hypothetical protein
LKRFYERRGSLTDVPFLIQVQKYYQYFYKTSV